METLISFLLLFGTGALAGVFFPPKGITEKNEIVERLERIYQKGDK